MFANIHSVIYTFLLLFLNPRSDTLYYVNAFALKGSSSLLSTAAKSSLSIRRSSCLSGGRGEYNEHRESEIKNIGFIGCGTIASAIIKGIATQSNVNIESIAVSKRSKSKSQALKEEFSSLVQVYDANQEILNNADVIFICVLPDQTCEVLSNLNFDADKHSLVSLVSTTTIDDLVTNSKLPPNKVSKMICLPSIARHEGVALHCCPYPDEFLAQLFESCGGVLTLQDESELQAAMVTTCIMGPLYGQMRESRDFVFNHTSGLTKQDASKLVIKQYMGAVEQAERLIDSADSLDDLIDEQTPGGLNEQALGNLDKLGGLKSHNQVMEALLSRIRGDSDGAV